MRGWGRVFGGFIVGGWYLCGDVFGACVSDRGAGASAYAGGGDGGDCVSVAVCRDAAVGAVDGGTGARAFLALGGAWVCRECC